MRGRANPLRRGAVRLATLCATFLLPALILVALAGCHAYEAVGPAASPDLAAPEVALVVEAAPAAPAAAFSRDGASFTANELGGTRIYTPYYTVFVPFGLWPEGYAYAYDDAVDGVGLGHMLVVTHPADGDVAVIVYCYDAAELGFVAPEGEYAVLDLGISQADPSTGVALAAGYAKQGYDAAHAELVAFAPYVAGVLLY